MKFLVNIVAVACIACSSAEVPENQAELKVVAKPSASQDASIDSAACQARGGELQKVCLSQTKLCVISYLDAGNKCSDSNECSGKCIIYNGVIPAGTPSTGSCAKNSNPCGCFAVVESGVVGDTICYD